MDYRKFKYDNENYLIFRTIEKYSRTTSGKSWKSKPDEVENEIIPPECYQNYITSIPFFNNFGYGAYCRAKFSYNEPGYLPTTVTTVSPFQDTKIIANFWFLRKFNLYKNACYREIEILAKADHFRVEFVDGSQMIYFYTGENESGIFDTKRNIWRG